MSLGICYVISSFKIDDKNENISGITRPARHIRSIRDPKKRAGRPNG